MKRFFNLLSRFIVILPALVLQILWVLLPLFFVVEFAPLVFLISAAVSLIVICIIPTKRGDTTYKFLWVIAIVIFPILGTMLYITCGDKRTSAPLSRRIRKNSINFSEILPKNSNSEVENTRSYQTLQLVASLSGSQITQSSFAKYYSCGEDMQPDMLLELSKAKHSIFIEYFIIENGVFLDSIIEILKQKVAENVDVRILYDDIGSISTFNRKNKRNLEKLGIKCCRFNPLHFVKFSLNNRDHKKMMIIDNQVCFSGGINIADEYINQKQRFGYWKDIGFQIRGKSVMTYTQMFTQFWNAYAKQKITKNMLFLPDFDQKSAKNDDFLSKNSDSTTISYYDSPSNKEPISNKFFVDAVSQANKYVYFYTPYLILDNILRETLISAAQRGVDVRIIIPGIPDKKIVYFLSRREAEELSKFGIKVYIYHRGFLHAKALIVDDEICSIGSVNLDYRSMFLNFENNTIFYHSPILQDLKSDFLTTQNQSKIIVLDNKKHFFKNFLCLILSPFAPFF